MGFVAEEVELEQIFSEHFDSSATSYSTDCSTLIYHRGLVQKAK
jgi:hypothetical protein